LFDADEDYTQRLKQIRKHLKDNDVTAFVYLFPDSKGAGELEILLMKLANWQDKAFFLSCYKVYMNCLKQGMPNQTEDFRAPDHKDMFQAYHSFFRQGAINFYDETLWNFSSADAQPLKDFLTPFVQSQP